MEVVVHSGEGVHLGVEVRVRETIKARARAPPYAGPVMLSGAGLGKGFDDYAWVRWHQVFLVEV